MRRFVLSAVHRHSVAFGCSPVGMQVELDLDIADEMHREVVSGEKPLDPLEVGVDATRETSVLVGGVGMIATTNAFEIESIDSAAIREDDVSNLFPVE